jgi:CheY-like chemotaxis protein
MSRGGTILVIDDSELLLSNVRAVLEPAGYEVVTTTRTVGTGRHLLTSNLVVLDLHMPGLDGNAVLASLRAALPAGATPPFFYLYTTDEAAAKEWQKHGFDGCLTQKGNDAALLAQVNAAFRMIRLRRLAHKSTPPPAR